MIKDLFSAKGKAQQRKVLWGVFGIMMLTWAGIGIPYINRKAKTDFEKFDQAPMHGIISAIRPTKIGVEVSVEGEKFVFYPVADERLNEYKSFTDVAAVNDSVAKLAHSDMLTLFTKGKVYKYTFKKH